MRLKEKGCEGLDWISLAEDKEKWRAVVDTVMNRWGSTEHGAFLDERRNCQLVNKDPASYSWINLGWDIHVAFLKQYCSQSTQQYI